MFKKTAAAVIKHKNTIIFVTTVTAILTVAYTAGTALGELAGAALVKALELDDPSYTEN